MASLHHPRFIARLRTAPERIKCTFREGDRRVVIDDRFWVVAPQYETILEPEERRHRPRSGEILGRKMCKFWNPLTNKVPVAILVLLLLHRRVHAERVYAHRTCLHLELREVDARLKVEKQTR